MRFVLGVGIFELLSLLSDSAIGDLNFISSTANQDSFKSLVIYSVFKFPALPLPSPLAGKGKVRLMAGKGREEK
jgi:hypothetical protein